MVSLVASTESDKFGSKQLGSVEAVDYTEALGRVRVVVDVTGQVAFKQGSANGPQRVYVDVTPARLNATLRKKQWLFASALLRQIRISQYDNSTVRIVFDLGTARVVRSFAVDNSRRLVVEILAEAAEARAFGGL
jgi:hypothetical protein